MNVSHQHTTQFNFECDIYAVASVLDMIISSDAIVKSLSEQPPPLRT